MGGPRGEGAPAGRFSAEPPSRPAGTAPEWSAQGPRGQVSPAGRTATGRLLPDLTAMAALGSCRGALTAGVPARPWVWDLACSLSLSRGRTRPRISSPGSRPRGFWARPWTTADTGDQRQEGWKRPGSASELGTASEAGPGSWGLMNGPWGQLGASEVSGMEKGCWRAAPGLAASAGNPLGIPRSRFSPLSDSISCTAPQDEASPFNPPPTG